MEEVRVADVCGGDQQTRLSSKAGSLLCCAVGACKVGTGLVVWDEGPCSRVPVHSSTPGMVLPHAAVGVGVGAGEPPLCTKCCQLCTPLWFPVLWGACVRLCRCRGALG